jgi:hypothetical protein
VLMTGRETCTRPTGPRAPRPDDGRWHDH